MERPVAGRATVNQIDVLWDLTDAAGQDYRIVFEARSHRHPIKQGALHAFRSVVDDIQDDARPVIGVMVTTSRYQPGAKDVAGFYGLLVLELREPTPTDLQNRHEIVVTIAVQRPIIEQVVFEAVEVYDETAHRSAALLERLTVSPPDGQAGEPRSLDRLLTDGELGQLGEPRVVHPVRRAFDPPQVLRVDGQPVASIQAVTAQVGEIAAPPVTVVITGPRSVALLLRDALTGARVWLGHDGEVWTVDFDQLRSQTAGVQWTATGG